ncbi:unnamed protein product [Paramecium sonneborni]|uniref:Transmembrane protein n=1 Tax=Paramecium sonneborni TaxID=65129 RepID=A0A8S1QM10_9CILI|nr:unnamed protein product [Paramecium sonneborni]
MKVLPFSLLTLQFHNTSLEENYQKQIQEQKLTYFRFLISFVILITFVGLFKSLIEQWGTFLILSLAVQTVLYLLALIFSRKISPYFKYILPSLYVAQYTYFIIGALNNLLQPHYVYGFIGGIYSCCMLNYLSVKMKILILSSSVWIMLGIFEIYSLANLNYIFLAIAATGIQAFYAYVYEYIMRLNFSQGVIINYQNDLLFQCSKQQMLILSFNNKKTFFELDFVNQKFELNQKIENDQTKLKEFLRNNFIINLDNDQMFGSLRIQKFANKQITLEDLLFEIYRAAKQDEQCFNQYEMIDQHNSQKEIQIQTINGLKTLFIIIISDNNNKIQIEKYEKQIKIINNQSINFSFQVGQKLQTIYKLIYELEIYNQENPTLNKIKGILQYILNETKNQLVFFSQNKSPQLLQKIDHCLLSSLIIALKPYFLYQCQQQQKYFELLFDNEDVQMQINTKQFTQILINIFNKILLYAKSNSTILFSITKDSNLNPQFDVKSLSKQSSKSKYDYLCSSSGNNQLLINLNFTFLTNEKISNFENSFVNKKIDCMEDDDFITIVNSYLLKQLSPYNNIFITQESRSKQKKNVKTTLTFYIYSDQTQIEQTYFKYINQENILQ